MIGTSDTRLAFLPVLGILALPSMGFAEGNLVVTPVEILESLPGCNGENQIAYRLAFGAKALPARIGDPNSAQPEFCYIRTRRAGDVSEIPIPCPPPEGEEVAQAASIDLIATVDMSGSILGCQGAADHSILFVDWQLSGQTPLGAVSVAGDLANPHLRVFFDAPAVQVPPPVGETVTNPVVWAIALEALPLDGPAGADGTLALTTYLGLSETKLAWGFCFRQGNEPQKCQDRPVDGTALAQLAGSAQLRDIARYVDEGRRP